MHPTRLHQDDTDNQILLEAFFTNASDYKILLNPDLQIVSFNRAADIFTWKFTGLRLEKGICISRFISSSFADEFMQICHQALSGQVAIFEHFVRFGSKKGEWYTFTFTPIQSDRAEVMGLTLVGRSADEQKDREKTIFKQSRALSLIADLQSHQVRQPVASILGFMNLIKEDNYEAKKEYLLCLELATKQLDSIIRTIVQASCSSMDH